jgi:hypothetical protein
MGLYVGPLFIGEVGWLCFSHACQSSESLPIGPFSDSLSRGILGSSPESFIAPSCIALVLTGQDRLTRPPLLDQGKLGHKPWALPIFR